MNAKKRILDASCLIRSYATKYPRPRPGTAERPPVHRPDPLTNNPNAITTSLENESLTFIHRPPPSSPSPYSLTTAPSSPLLWPKATPIDEPLPPISRPRLNKVPPQRASDEVLAEIRRLRLSDPTTYTRTKLAKMFGCTQTFIGSIAALKKSQRKTSIRKEEEKREAERVTWSERKQLVRQIRAKRRELW
ncbi:hypothetical protein AMATHDRAFT_136248 [Amanita thiersii Skay4041]|uniref:Uncharacterized protein n=1 Tax=Amanita thiersii Skay4041 TaxID=703135 RepID=A0A2A9P0B6_9AGAR|nr:hypothetical protein AMATHDRAFT_136248 [Amanita thiersii Skay4041]